MIDELGGIIFIITMIAGFYFYMTARKKILREVAGVGLIAPRLDSEMRHINSKIDKELENLKHYKAALMQRVDAVSEHATTLMNPKVMAALGENIIINTLATLGAEKLKEMGFKDADISRINMARQGLRRAGHEIGEGLGVNKLIGDVGNVIPGGAGKDGEGGGILAGDGMIGQLVQLYRMFKGGGLDGIMGGGESQGGGGQEQGGGGGGSW